MDGGAFPSRNTVSEFFGRASRCLHIHSSPASYFSGFFPLSKGIVVSGGRYRGHLRRSSSWVFARALLLVYRTKVLKDSVPGSSPAKVSLIGIAEIGIANPHRRSLRLH